MYPVVGYTYSYSLRLGISLCSAGRPSNTCLLLCGRVLKCFNQILGKQFLSPKILANCILKKYDHQEFLLSFPKSHLSWPIHVLFYEWLLKLTNNKTAINKIFFYSYYFFSLYKLDYKITLIRLISHSMDAFLFDKLFSIVVYAKYKSLHSTHHSEKLRRQDIWIHLKWLSMSENHILSNSVLWPISWRLVCTGALYIWRDMCLQWELSLVAFSHCYEFDFQHSFSGWGQCITAERLMPVL